MAKPEVKILRMKRGDQGTEGSVIIQGEFYCYSFELPWRDNQSSISCIPPGKYKCEMRKSPRFGWRYWVKDVPNRSFILIHGGNWAGDVNLGYKSHVNGCILFGRQMGYLQGQRAILNSQLQVKLFMNFMQDEPFKLEILEDFKEE
jgi:hypothetical protein